MQNVIDLLIRHFPTLYFQGCVIHYLDLLLEDWGKKPWMKRIVKRGESYCFFYSTTPFAICNFLSLQNQLNASRPH
jgi:hypothetical protein